jgi:predicted nucleotidyltransferase
METLDVQSDPALAEIVRRLVEEYHPERVYLFGSRARGDAGPDSDYDLMLVMDDPPPPSLERSRRTCEALRGMGTAADILIWSREAFDRRLHVLASLPATIVREGRLLHGA